MLYLAQHDTYKALDNFAKYPTRRWAIMQFEMMMIEAARRVRWESFTAGNADSFGVYQQLCLGMPVTDAVNRSIRSAVWNRLFDKNAIATMEADEVDDLYIKQCKEAGVSIDPQALIDMRAAEEKQR